MNLLNGNLVMTIYIKEIKHDRTRKRFFKHLSIIINKHLNEN